MNKDIAAGQWKQLKGKVREQWGRLTDDEVDQIAGRYESLVGKIQEKYGMAREQAEDEAQTFLMDYDNDTTTHQGDPKMRLS
jgi:uncharacterized protein YjbJ (UPF0337 family)